ncbi:MAG: TFIIB-type zinc ribbon-containing protein [Clostridiaceae bacterium]|nr:TFIIB-type zinc ribbon-containing protein [Eubacteriales bacterium]
MNKKQIPPWRKKLNIANNLAPLAFLFLLAGYVLFMMQTMRVDVVADVPRWAGIALLAFSVVFAFPIGAIRRSAWREAYSETLRRERSIQRIAQILNRKPKQCAKEIALLIKEGKFDALYVDTEKGVVVVSHEEADAEAPQAALDGAAPRRAGEPLSVVCPGCGARNRVRRGQTAECEYCGAVVEGK